MRVPLPDGPSGAWREVRWRSEVPRTLEWAALDVEPCTAFRQLRVYRANGELLANESWDPSRTRGLRVYPESNRIAAGEELTIRAMAWSEPVQLTAVLIWKGSE